MPWSVPWSLTLLSFSRISLVLISLVSHSHLRLSHQQPQKRRGSGPLPHQGARWTSRRGTKRINHPLMNMLVIYRLRCVKNAKEGKIWNSCYRSRIKRFLSCRCRLKAWNKCSQKEIRKTIASVEIWMTTRYINSNMIGWPLNTSSSSKLWSRRTKNLRAWKMSRGKGWTYLLMKLSSWRR